MKADEEIMNILEAYDLCGSFRLAAELAGCDHHTVARYVALRDQGRAPTSRRRRARSIDPYLPKVEEWIERSHGKLRADVAHTKLAALGYAGAARTTRRAVAAVKAAYQQGERRRFRPWLPEPGLWLQWDYSDGPRVEDRPTWLFCAWLAWSRYRVVLPLRDKRLPSVLACLDTTLRRVGGVPTYALTDNEKTVTVEHIAGLPVRHPELVAFGRHYGLTIATCVPADPQSKGGAEATVRLAQADLVPTDANLRAAYACFGELRTACVAWCDQVNARPHRATGCAPNERLVVEQQRLHRLPVQPYTAAFGVTRRVGSTLPVVQFAGGEYSVPDAYTGQTVWVRDQDNPRGDEIIIVHVGRDGRDGPTEIARHLRTQPGQPRHDPTHFGPAPAGPLQRVPRARSPEEVAFLALGPSAPRWLQAAAAAGTGRLRAKMAAAVALAQLHGAGAVEAALAVAAEAERFGEDDVASILRHQAVVTPGATQHASDRHTLQGSTGGWRDFGMPGGPGVVTDAPAGWAVSTVGETRP
jgi:transposase